MITPRNDKEENAETRGRPGRRWRLIAAGLIVLFALYSVAGFLVLPALVKHLIPKLFDEHLDLSVDVQKVRVNPYVLSLRLQQFAAFTSDGHPLLAFEDLYVNFQLLYLLRLRFQFKEISLQGLEISAKDSREPLFSLPSLTVRRVEADTRNKTLGIDSIKTRDARLKGWLNPDGSLGLLSVLSLAPFEGREALLSGVAEDSAVLIRRWKIRAREILLDENTLDFEDRTIDPPFRLSLKPIRMALKNFTNQENTPTQVLVSVKDETGGSVTVSGETTVQPLSADLDVEIDGVALRQFEPYIQTVATVDLENGRMNTKGRITYASENRKGNPKIGFQGRFGIADLEAVDSSSDQPVFKLPELAVSDIDFALEPNRLKINEVALRKPQAELRIDSDGNLNVKTVLKSDREGIEAIKRSLLGKLAHTVLVQIKGPLPFQIDRIRIDEAGVKAADYSFQPPFFMDVKPLRLNLTQIDSARKAAVNMEVDGVVGDGARLKAGGKIEPFSDDVSARMKMSLKNFDVTQISLYAGKYAGYKLQKGNLSLSMDYTLSKKKVNGTNDIFLQKLTLGEPVDSPDAVNLPLEMAVALMKDRNENITLNVPISGKVDDPHFRIGGVLANTLMTLVTSVAASPLHALGALAGGLSADQLRIVAFQPGSDALDPAEEEKLSKLAAALLQRPALLLQIEATADKAVDGPALSGAESLLELARKRGEAIQAHLTDEGKVEPERVYVIKEVIETEPTDRPVKSVLSVLAP